MTHSSNTEASRNWPMEVTVGELEDAANDASKVTPRVWAYVMNDIETGHSLSVRTIIKRQLRSPALSSGEGAPAAWAIIEDGAVVGLRIAKGDADYAAQAWNRPPLVAPLYLARPSLEEPAPTVSQEGPWKKLAMQAMRYLNAEQIAEAAKAAGAHATICGSADPSTTHTDCRSSVGEVVALIDAAIINLRVASRSPELSDPAIVAALADLRSDREIAALSGGIPRTDSEQPRRAPASNRGASTNEENDHGSSREVRNHDAQPEQQDREGHDGYGQAVAGHGEVQQRDAVVRGEREQAVLGRDPERRDHDADQQPVGVPVLRGPAGEGVLRGLYASGVGVGDAIADASNRLIELRGAAICGGGFTASDEENYRLAQDALARVCSALREQAAGVVRLLESKDAEMECLVTQRNPDVTVGNSEGRTPTCIVERIDDRTLRCQTHNVCWQDTEMPPPSCATTTWMTPEYKARADAIRRASVISSESTLSEEDLAFVEDSRQVTWNNVRAHEQIKRLVAIIDRLQRVPSPKESEPSFDWSASRIRLFEAMHENDWTKALVEYDALRNAYLNAIPE